MFQALRNKMLDEEGVIASLCEMYRLTKTPVGKKSMTLDKVMIHALSVRLRERSEFEFTNSNVLSVSAEFLSVLGSRIDLSYATQVQLQRDEFDCTTSDNSIVKEIGPNIWFKEKEGRAYILWVLATTIMAEKSGETRVIKDCGNFYYQDEEGDKFVVIAARSSYTKRWFLEVVKFTARGWYPGTVVFSKNSHTDL